MKFIPNAAFDALNISLNEVDALGCLITIKLEAFTCRPCKSDRSLRTALDAKTQGGCFITPPLGPINGQLWELDDDDDFRLEKSVSSDMPGSSHGSTMTMVNSLGQEYSPTLDCHGSTSDPITRTDGSSASEVPVKQQQSTSSPNIQLHMYSQLNEEQTVKGRMLFLCGALNAIHGSTDYDFSCLAPSDFLLVCPAEFIEFINDKLRSLPREVQEAVGTNGEMFWRAIGSLVGSEAAIYNNVTQTTECEIFKFVCHNCDPVAQAKLWSHHYLIYNKKHRVIVSVLLYGEGNLYGEVCGRNRVDSQDMMEEEVINEMMDDDCGEGF